MVSAGVHLADALDRFSRQGPFEEAVATHLVELLGRRRRRPVIPDAEAEVWRSVGAAVDPDPAVEADALSAASEMSADLERRSYRSPSEVAAALGVGQPRVSQMTTAGQLFAFRDLSGGLRYPRWQVVDRRPLPGVATVLAAIRPGVHPLVVDHWFTRVNVDLEIDDERVSPVTWLAAGGTADVPARLASTL